MDMALGILSRRTASLCKQARPFLNVYSLTAPNFSCASSKHLQTRRFLDTIHGYLLDVQRMLVQLHREANERPAPFVDHAGVLRDSKTGRPISGHVTEVTEDEDAMGEFFSALDLCSTAENFVLQWAIPSSTAQRSSWLVEGNVTSSPTSAKLYHWPSIDWDEGWSFAIVMSLHALSALCLTM